METDPDPNPVPVQHQYSMTAAVTTGLEATILIFAGLWLIVKGVSR